MGIKQISRQQAYEALLNGTIHAAAKQSCGGWRTLGLSKTGARIEARPVPKMMGMTEYRLNGYAPNGSDLDV